LALALTWSRIQGLWSLVWQRALDTHPSVRRPYQGLISREVENWDRRRFKSGRKFSRTQHLSVKCWAFWVFGLFST